jgi:hypothetical protein
MNGIILPSSSKRVAISANDPAARVVLSGMLGSKDVIEGRDGRTDVSDSYRTYSCKNGITCPDLFLYFIPR